MKTEQVILTKAGKWETMSCNNLGAIAQLVFIFGSKELLKAQHNFDYVRNLYPHAEIVGCSTSGEIYHQELLNYSMVCTAVWFESSTVKVVCEHINSMDESYNIGSRLIGKLDRTNLSHVFVLSEGLTINGSELTKGLNSEFEIPVSITGGLAGDQADFNETVIVHNQAGIKNIVIAVGFYGKNLNIGYGSLGGWDTFGVDRLVTRSKANILYELDGQPALTLYKKYLGSHAAELPASALLFPLSFLPSEAPSPVVRTVLSVDETNGSMIFAGDIPEGSYVRLMKANSDKLIDGAADAAEQAKSALKQETPDLAILISCVGRKLVLKQRTDEELEIVCEVLGNHTTVTGFYSYGEISPLNPLEKHCELHNQTMTITTFKEL